MPDYPQPDDERVIDDIEALKVYFDPLRIRLVQAMAHQPRSVNELAAELNVPFTRLYYHLHLLEQHGFIRLIDVRNISGAVEEKYYQIAARLFRVDRSLLSIGTPEGEKGLDALLENMIEAAAEDIRKSAREGVINLDVRPPDSASLLLRRGYVRLSPERAQYYYERFIALTREMLDEESSTSDNYYGVLLAVYPSSLPLGENDNSREDGADS
jgi:DNA-binding transcriptional ArsR family regulator